MTGMIFRLVKWYALLRGAQKALKKRRPMAIADLDRLLMRFYIEPIQEQLNAPSLLESFLAGNSEQDGQDPLPASL